MSRSLAKHAVTSPVISALSVNGLASAPPRTSAAAVLRLHQHPGPESLTDRLVPKGVGRPGDEQQERYECDPDAYELCLWAMAITITAESGNQPNRTPGNLSCIRYRPRNRC